MNFTSQIVAVVRSSLQSLSYRWRLAVSTLVGVALVVMVLLGFLAMSEGFRKTLEETGSDGVALLVSEGAKSETFSMLDASQVALARELGGIRKDAGNPMVSAEVYKGISLVDADGMDATLGLRGMDSEGLRIRPGLVITNGRAFSEGSRELLVGEAAVARHPQLAVGNTVAIAGAQWQVVGTFSAGSSLYGAELWTDSQSLKGVFGLDTSFNAVRIALANGVTPQQLQATLDSDPRLSDVQAVGEAEFFSAQAQGVVKIIEFIGWPIAVIMAIGAIAAAINTMYNSVEAQTREIATLRALGFGRLPIFIAVMVEAAVLVLLGGILGSLAAFALFEGLEGSTLSGSQTQVTFKFAISAASVVQAIVLAAVIGLLGGLLPALHASRKPVLDGLRE